MTQTDLCQRCGGPLTKSQALNGRCPRCMLVLGLESTYLDGDNGEGGEAEDGSTLPGFIGRYRILRVIGAGGMGVVYEAEQGQPRRIVALKIIKPGLVSDELLRRFEQESQALGRLQHPGIAQIYEAGTVDTGFGPQPYFAMELIIGQSPRDYAESHHLNINQRLEIMVKICDAVQHAHQRGLIHRDLKPANILVDDNAQPKILDFGVARATDSDTRSTLQTDVGQLIGTLAYMSPEQALADPMDIDTRSDVYALGVILYELLAGRLPYTISKKLHESIQAIREEDPARLSESNRNYRGDIETIVGKALEKDRARRYASASEMAADLRRFLKDEPIAARPPSASYQLQKFTRRHKTLVGGVAAVFAILVAGIIVSTTLLIRARRAESDARSAAIRADEAGSLAAAVQQVALDVFGRPDSGPIPFEAATSSNISVNDSLDRVVKNIGFHTHGNPQQEAAIRELVAEMFSAQGRYKESLDQLEIALKLRSRQGETDPHALRDTLRMAQICLNLRLFSKASDLLTKVTFDSRNATSETDSLMQSTVRSFVTLYRLNGSADRSIEFPKLERFFKDDIIDYYRRHSEEGKPFVQDAENALFDLYLNYTPPKYAEAETFWLQATAERRRSLGEGDRSALTAEKQLISLFTYLEPQPDYAKSEAYLKTLAEAQRRSLGDDNPATQTTINYLVSIYLDRPQPRYAEAETFLKRIREEAQRKSGNSNAVRNASIALSNVYFKQARYPEAEQLLTPFSTTAIVADAIAHPLVLTEQLAIPNYIYILQLNNNLGSPIPIARAMAHLKTLEQPTIVDVLDRRSQIYIKQGNSAQARETSGQVTMLLEAAVNANRKEGGWFLGRPLMSMGSIALRYIDQDRFEEADSLLSTVLGGYRQLAGNSSNAPDIAILLTLTALRYTEKGHDRQAEKLLNEIVKLDEAGVSRTYTLSNSLVRLGAWYLDRGRYEEADGAFDRLNKMQVAPFGPFGSMIRTAMANTADVYTNGARNAFVLGQPDRARHVLEKSLEIRRRLLVMYRTQPKGENSNSTQATMSGIGINLAMLGRNPEAEAIFTQLITIQKTVDNVRPESKCAAIADLGWTQFHQQNNTAAEATLREGLHRYEQIQSDSWERYNTESMLGAALVASKKFSEAEPYVLTGYEKLLERKPANPIESAFTGEVEPGERILTLYQEWGKPGKVAEWRQKLLANKPASATTTPALR